MAESLRSAAQDAATRHAEDIIDIVKGEREELAKERDMAQSEWERLLAQSDAERAAIKDGRIHALENELADVKSDLENERQLRATEEAERRERERAESLEREEGVRNQLSDITNLLQDLREDCARKRETSDDRWREQQERNERKDALCQEIHDLVARMIEDRDADRIREDEERLATESKPGLFIFRWITLPTDSTQGIDKVLEELARQNAEQRELLNNLSDSMKSFPVLFSISLTAIVQVGALIALVNMKRRSTLSVLRHKSKCLSMFAE
jgi:hypothetical protein